MLCAFALLWVVGCQKESKPNEQHLSALPIASSREENSFSKAWLEYFQSNLAAAVNDQEVHQTYSPTEIIFGIESLISMASPVETTAQMHKSKTQHIQLDLGNNSELIKKLYSASFGFHIDHFESMNQTETKPVMVDISLDSIKGNIGYFSIKSVMGVRNTCTIEAYDGQSGVASFSCDGYTNEPFEFGDGFRMGWGDEELELIEAYDPTNCESECGDLAACELGTTTAPEQIEAAINDRFPKPVSSDPKKPYFGDSLISHARLRLSNQLII